MTDLDRKAARALRVFRRGHLDVHFVNVDPGTYRQYHGVVANGVLWPLFHGLVADVRRTITEVAWTRSWQAYREVNIEFAMAIATYAPARAAVLVDDHHLLLLGHYLRLLRPDLRAVHFSHTRFCTPEELRELPVSESLDLLEGLAAYRAAGFSAEASESAFRVCCDDMRVTAPRTFVLPIEKHRGDPAMLAETPDGALAGGAHEWLAGLLAEANTRYEIPSRAHGERDRVSTDRVCDDLRAGSWKCGRISPVRARVGQG